MGARSLWRLATLLAAGGAAFLLSQRESVSRAPQTAAARIFYTPSQEAIDADLDLIGQARERIDFAAYVLTDRAIMEALGQAARRGVKVRVYMDRAFTTRGNGRSEGALGALLATSGVSARFKSREAGMMHLKSYAVDGRWLRTGSANFSFSGGRYQDNDVVVLDSPPLAAAFVRQFETMWARADNQAPAK